MEEREYVIRVKVVARQEELPGPSEVATGIRLGLHEEWFRDVWPRAGWFIESITGVAED